MSIITLDMETYYDTAYSLTKLQTDAYVLDDRYETIGVSVKVDDAETQWFSGSEIETAGWLHANFDWKNSDVVCHHTLFDGFIMSQRFGIRPKRWLDTKGMAVHLFPYLRSYSLAALAKHFGLQDKGTTVHAMLGRRRESLSRAELAEYGEYCKLDVDLTYQLAQRFISKMPAIELMLIDMTIRMFTEPQFIGDAAVMAKLAADEVSRKEEVLRVSGADKDTLMSNDKLAAAIQARGVEPPRKVSAKTGKETWAFAKTDEAFTEMLEHEDPVVQALVAARLGVKSTIAETRARMMCDTANRRPIMWATPAASLPDMPAVAGLESWVGGGLPVYLNYWGAKTTGRYSGGNKINWQNLPARGPSAGLRDTIVAPPGRIIVVGDSSNIELRVAMAAAGQNDVVEKIANGEDLYCDFASKMFGRTITKADKRERMLGKIAMLSLQYGAGWRKFKEMVRQQVGTTLNDSEAEDIVRLYRRIHYRIVDMWTKFDEQILPEIAAGNANLMAVDDHGWVLCTGEGYGVNGGCGVVYHKLRREQVVRDGRAGEEWVYEMTGKPVKLYGGKAFENYCQHVARQIVMWQTGRIHVKYPVALSVHDEAVTVPLMEELDDCSAYMTESLSLAPKWCRGQIPLACEVAHGMSYGAAK